MSNLLVIAQKEIKDFKRSKFIIILFAFLAIVMTLSVIVASADFHNKVIDYNNYVKLISKSSAASVPRPQIYPLQLLRGSIEYLELLGALFAIVLGYGMVAKEKFRGTLQLIFSRAIGKYQIAQGKILALGIIWASVILSMYLSMFAALIIVGSAKLTGIEISKLLISALLSWIYLMFWSCLSMAITSKSKRLSTALITCLVLWLSIVLILPQIGDTMDPDNQVPGGLFHSLQITSKHQEKAILKHFTGYESTRNFIEATSITKHYERSSFADLGIKSKYNDQSISKIWSGIFRNVWWLVTGAFFSLLLSIFTTTKKQLLRKE